MELRNQSRTAGRTDLPRREFQPASPVDYGFPWRRLWMPARWFDAACPESLDRPDLEDGVLREEIAALAAANEHLGGHWLAVHYVKPLLGPAPGEATRILDLGTGGADIPRAIAAWARRRQRRLSITAVDRNPRTVQLAREACRDWPEISIEQHDLLDLPFAADSFEVVLCSSVLHHFSAPEAVVALRNIGQIARTGYVVSDLRRNWPAICMAYWLPDFGSRMFRQDAVQSCRAAFTVGELQAMARQAGLTDFRVRRHQGVFRMVLAGRR